MSYLIFFKKIKGRWRKRGNILYNSHKIFHRGLFFSQFSGVDSKKMSITVQAITESLYFSLQFQKDSVRFSCLKKIIVDI